MRSIVVMIAVHIIKSDVSFETSLFAFMLLSDSRWFLMQQQPSADGLL